jgi:hypothetical protein
VALGFTSPAPPDTCWVLQKIWGLVMRSTTACGIGLSGYAARGMGRQQLADLEYSLISLSTRIVDLGEVVLIEARLQHLTIDHDARVP